MAMQAREAAIPPREIPIVQPRIVSSEIELTTTTSLAGGCSRIKLFGSNYNVRDDDQGNGKRVGRAGLRRVTVDRARLFVTRSLVSRCGVKRVSLEITVIA